MGKRAPLTPLTPSKRIQTREIRSSAGLPPRLLLGMWSLSSVWGAWGCGGSDQEVLDRFFTGIEYEDSNMVAAVSLVAFPGEGVASWRVLEIRPTRSERFRLPELQEEAKAAKKARDEQFSRFSDFRRAHYDDLVRIQNRLDQDPDHAFGESLADLRRQWDAYVAERRTLELTLRERERGLEDERRPARESVLTGDVIDLFDGEVLTREVLVGVESPGDAGEETSYLFTLRRYDLTRRLDNFTPPSRWIITRIEEQEG